MFRWRSRRKPPQPAPDDAADSGYGRVGETPLVYISFYLDLPFDAGISESHGFNAIDFSEPALEDWSEFDLQRFLSMPPLPEPAVRPCTALYFRRVTLEERAPFTNVLRAWRDMLPEGVADVDDVPYASSRSVVHAVRIVPRDSVEFGNEWLHEQFTFALSALNGNLLAIGAAAEDHTIGPITERQLPPVVLGFEGDMRNVRGGTIRELVPFMFVVHDDRGARERDHDASVINYALAIADRAGQGPLFPAMEFSFAARRSLDMGLFSQAVLESGTAIELLVNRVVMGIELEKGSPQERIDRVLETSFQNLVRDHLARRLGVEAKKPYEASDPLNAWLRVVYQLRNRVAHTGHRPTLEETLQALRLTDELIHFVATTAEKAALGITFPGPDELRPSQFLDERSWAREDESAVSLPTREAFRRGLSAWEARDILVAKAAFTEADEKGSPGAAHNLAMIHFSEGDDELAVAALRRATERGHHLAPTFLGVNLISKGEEDEAEELLQMASPVHPIVGPLASYFLGVIARERDNLPDAADHFKRASVFDDFMFAGEAAWQRGNILREHGNPAAIEAYRRGAELGSAKAASNLAALLLARDDVDGGITAYQRALELSDVDTEGQIAFNLANALDRLDRAAEAKPIYERAARAGEPWSLVRLGGMAAEADDLATAERRLRAAHAFEDTTVRAAAVEVATRFGLSLTE